MWLGSFTSLATGRADNARHLSEPPTVSYHRDRMPREVMIAETRAFRDRLRQRRTVRDVSSDPVPDEVIDFALETAASAPSGANQQPWKFVVVTDPALKSQIRVAAEQEEYGNCHGRMRTSGCAHSRRSRPTGTRSFWRSLRS